MLKENLQCGKFELSLEKPLIMGILNVTPDSFSDGGKFSSFDSAVKQAQQMIANGADIIDIGGESTRPGAMPVTADEELARVVPVIERLVSEIEVPISIDTSKAVVMYEAVHAGASLINDVYALRQEGALETAAKLKVPVCLMHMQGEPRSMQSEPEYSDVVEDVLMFLHERANACQDAGIDKNHIILDPGFGFGKMLEHNLKIFRELGQFKKSGYPLLVGLSRKSMFGQITGKDVVDRLPASLAAALLAVQNGANILRVHDVAETRDVLSVLEAVSGNK